jgi:hypothetical protein
MSTIFCKKFSSYLIHSKHLSFKKYSLKTLDKSLTGPGVSKAGRPDLYCRGPYSDVFKHVFYRLDASQPYNWYLDGLPRFPYEPQGDRFDRGAGKTPRLVPEPRFACPVVDRHGRIGVGNRQGVCPGLFRSPGNKSNVCNKRRELDPEGPLRCGLPGGPNHLGCQGRVAAELHAPFLDVGTGDVQLISCQPLGVLQDADHLDIVFEGIAEDVGDDRRIKLSQYREFFGNERANPHILESHGVEHPGRGLAQPGGGGTLDGFSGQAFGNEAAETVEVNEVGKFEAVTESSAGRENRIPQAQRADIYAKVDGDRGSHFAQKDNTKPFLVRAKSMAENVGTTPTSLSIDRLFQGLVFGVVAGPCSAAACTTTRFARASARTRPSREVRVTPQRAASVGAMSAGVADWKYSPGWMP